MNRSGIIKRGLAATAISALAVAGIPALAGTAHAAVDVTVAGVNGWTAFDIDEFATAGDLIVVTVTDGANGPGRHHHPVRAYAYTPFGGVAQAPTDGVVRSPVPSPAPTARSNLTFVPGGSRHLHRHRADRRHPHRHPAPSAVMAGEAEITWADGVSASSPQNGSDTYAATLALTNPAATPLAGRTSTSATTTVPATRCSLPAPSVRVNDANADSTTGADGKFSCQPDRPRCPGDPRDRHAHC